MMMQYSLVSVMTVYCSAPVLMLMLLLAGVYLKVGIVIQQHHQVHQSRCQGLSRYCQCSSKEGYGPSP